MTASLLVLHFSGPVLTLVGVVLGMWGTLLMCRPYHPFSTWKVVGHVFHVVSLLLRGNTTAAQQTIANASDFSKVNDENRRLTLAGVYVLVFSFLIQTIGAVLICIDLIAHPG